MEGDENLMGFYELDSITDEEVLTHGSFRALNEEMKAWYFSDKENIDKNHIDIN